MATIPLTKARLQPYITINSSIETALGTGLVGSIANGQFSTQVEIGAIGKISFDFDRPTGLWRELNTASQGLPIEIYPTLPTYKFTATRLMLYNTAEDSFLKAFGFGSNNPQSGGVSGYDILSQTTPVQIRISLDAPNNADQKTLVLNGVWFENIPMEFDMAATRELTIPQAVRGQASSITVS